MADDAAPAQLDDRTYLTHTRMEEDHHSSARLADRMPRKRIGNI
jgi:hypothetical protein